MNDFPDMCPTCSDLRIVFVGADEIIPCPTCRSDAKSVSDVVWIYDPDSDNGMEWTNEETPNDARKAAE